MSSVLELPIATYCAWENAKACASDKRVPFHERWRDFDSFVEDLGTAPEGTKLICRSRQPGYVPGNVYWHAHASRHTQSFDACPIAVDLLSEGLISTDIAIELASIDANPDYITERCGRLRQATAGQAKARRRKAFANLITRLKAEFLMVPQGEPNRWEIRRRAATLRRDALADSRDSYSEIGTEREASW